MGRIALMLPITTSDIPSCFPKTLSWCNIGPNAVKKCKKQKYIAYMLNVIKEAKQG